MYPEELEELLLECEREIDRYWFLLEDGEPVETWYNGVASTLATFFLIALMLGLGKSSTNVETKYLAQKRLQAQLEYLRNFAGEIDERRKNGDELKRGWRSRSLMYSGSVQAAYWEGKLFPMPINLPVPGDGSTECLTRCRCWWRIDYIDEENHDYDLYWEKEPAENCESCKWRSKNWYPIQVRSGVLLAPLETKEVKSTHKHLRGQHDQQKHGYRGASVAESDAGYRQKKDIAYTGNYYELEELARNIGLSLDNNSLDQTLKNIYSYNSDEVRLKTVITNVEKSRGNNPGIIITGEIIDKNGERAGMFDRLLYKSRNEGEGLIAQHSAFFIDEYFQNSGFGTAFYRKTEEEYKKRGVNMIMLEANLEIGGYAWARVGFSPAKPEADKLIQRAKEIWEEESKFVYGSKYRDMPFPKINNFFELACLSAPWDIGTHFGKKFLLHSDYSQTSSRSWIGTKILKESDLGYQIGELYYKEKDRKRRQ